MERILTAEQMRSADKFTIENLGVEQSVLVERAGYAVAEEIIKRFHGGRVLICVGNGNNGADGKIVAEILSKTHGFRVTLLTVSNGILKVFEKQFDIIVDCIFGTGLNRLVEGKYKKTIEKINKSKAFIISCDIPSGLNADNGKPMGISVKANLTIAIQEFKLGHFLNDGPDYCGEIISKDIGISIWGEEFVKRLNDESVASYFVPTARNVHKGNFGKCAIIGGSRDFSGSVILSTNALGAFKMGVGYVYLAIPESLQNGYIGKIPECILIPVKDDGCSMILDEGAISKIIACNSIAVGMGMGCSSGVYSIIKYLLNNYSGALIIDADGLNTLSEYGVEILKTKKCKVVLTPHVGEFSRLSGIEKDEILNNPIICAEEFAKKYQVTVLLKNATSIITDGNETFLNTTGCSAMAKAGSGDVLSGFCAGLMARNEVMVETVSVSSYLFGKAGEIAEKEQNQFTVTASDIIKALPKAINKLR